MYVGESHEVNDKWDLWGRLKQHFRIGDKGGLLYKISNGDKEKALKLRNKFICKLKVTFEINTIVILISNDILNRLLFDSKLN